jgi:diguanylate cyclase (GGDEF)-like protein
MGDGLRTIRLITTDESLIASTRAAAAPLAGWEVAVLPSVETLLSSPPTSGDVLLLDGWMRGGNCYEVCRKLTGRTRCRTFLVVEQGNELAEPIARFCGATGTLARPITSSSLRKVLDQVQAPKGLPLESRGAGGGFTFPEALLVDISTGRPNESLIATLIDIETGLFGYAFLNFKLDEEFKRARRFDHPLACVMLGFEGRAIDDTLRELAAIFLESSRDTDVLGRFDENTFLFLLPNTGPDGASIMAERVAELAEERGLCDLVGDPIQISVGISSYPNPEIERREELYARARTALERARASGGGVVRSR